MAQNIKRYRKAAHLTQEQLAERAKTSTTYIGTIEIGKKFPSLRMLEQIAAALNVQPLQLFQIDAPETNQDRLDISALKKSLAKNISSAIEASLAEL